MTDPEKLKRDMDTLRASIQGDWQDLAQLKMDEATRDGIMQHLSVCAGELEGLRRRLEELSA